MKRPTSITTGSDGALWFTNTSNGAGSIGRITTAGAVSIFEDPKVTDPSHITTGPDGAQWFINYAWNSGYSIGRISTTGNVSVYSDPGINSPRDITAGPDGALWFTQANSIGRITTSGAVSTFPQGSGARYITKGPDDALWFAGDTTIGRMTTSGSVSRYTVPGIRYVNDITSGPDNALWFTTITNDWPSIGRISTSGVMKFYTVKVSDAYALGDLVSGSDGALWFGNTTLAGPYSIGRITTDGVITGHSDPGLNGLITAGVTSGPDNAVWFTRIEKYGGSTFVIGRIKMAIVIGESSLRTGPASKEFGADIWHGFSPEDSHLQTCAKNEAWIDAQIKNGLHIYDIGIDAGRQQNRSPYYQLELREIKEAAYGVEQRWDYASSKPYSTEDKGPCP